MLRRKTKRNKKSKYQQGGSTSLIGEHLKRNPNINPVTGRYYRKPGGAIANIREVNLQPPTQEKPKTFQLGGTTYEKGASEAQAALQKSNIAIKKLEGESIFKKGGKIRHSKGLEQHD